MPGQVRAVIVHEESLIETAHLRSTPTLLQAPKQEPSLYDRDDAVNHTSQDSQHQDSFRMADEELFLTQLRLRARLLDEGFQVLSLAMFTTFASANPVRFLR